MIALSSETTENGGAPPTRGEDRGPADNGQRRVPPPRRGRPRRPLSPRAYERRAGQLHEEAERLFNSGHHSEAEQRVRRLLALQKRVVGRLHPDFALGLSMLGELRFLQDDLAGAEKVFRRALSIRGKVLGNRHPDYAVSLACLGGVLWRVGATDEAERRFREALAIRYKVLGDRHPDSIQTRKELARILRLRGDWFGAHALTAEVYGSDAARGDLTVDVAVLSADLARLGETLAPAARLMASPGSPPPAAAVEELAACRQHYERLRDETLRRIAALDVPPPAPRLLETLHDFAGLLDDLAEAEALQESREEVRKRALAVLERVLALDYFRNEDFPPLRECQDQVERLVESIEGEHWSALPTQTETLAEGTHALYSLLRLVEEPARLSDAQWAELHEQVSEALGRPIASAASRARLLVAGRPPRPAPPAARSAPPPRQDLPLPPLPPITELAQEPQFAPPRPEAVPAAAPIQPAPTPRRQAAPAAASPEMDPRVAMLRDLAVASLVPTMGKVINLPTASSNESDTHRLLRMGQAPKVVEPQSTTETEHAQSNDLHRRGFSAEAGRRYGTYRRIGSGVIAGPLSLNQSHDAAANLMASDALLDPERLLGLMRLIEDDGRRW